VIAVRAVVLEIDRDGREKLLGGKSWTVNVQLSKEGAMSSNVQLFDATGRRRSPATLAEFHVGRAPANKGQRYPADPPTVDEIIAIMRVARGAPYGNRLNGLIVVLWRAGLRINEALSLTETDLEQRRGSILVRHGEFRIRNSPCYAAALAMPSCCAS
jgi:integrase